MVSSTCTRRHSPIAAGVASVTYHHNEWIIVGKGCVTNPTPSSSSVRCRQAQKLRRAGRRPLAQQVGLKWSCDRKHNALKSDLRLLCCYAVFANVVTCRVIAEEHHGSLCRSPRWPIVFRVPARPVHLAKRPRGFFSASTFITDGIALASNPLLDRSPPHCVEVWVGLGPTCMFMMKTK